MHSNPEALNRKFPAPQRTTGTCNNGAPTPSPANCFPTSSDVPTHAYVIEKRRAFAYDIEWLRTVKSNLGVICKASGRDVETTLTNLELELGLSVDIIRAMLRESVDNDAVDEAIRNLEELVEDSDDIMPDPDSECAASLRWCKIRQEYVAQVELLRSLSVFSRMKARYSGLSNFQDNRELVQSAVSSARMCASYRPKEVDAILTARAADRISLAVNLLLSVFSCFVSRWIFPRKPNENVENMFRVHDSGPIDKFSLPSFVNIRPDIPLKKDLEESLIAVTNVETWGADESALFADAWDLRRVVDVAAWNIQNGKIRALLRKMFPSLPEKPQRHFWCSKEGARATGQVAFLSAIGKWNPSDSQVRFWRTALYKYGRDDAQNGEHFVAQRHYFAESLLREGHFARAVREIRGFVTGSSDRVQQQRVVFGILGLQYAEIADHHGLDRVYEALHYLTTYKKLGNGQTGTLPAGNLDSVVLVGIEGDIASCGVTDEVVTETLNRFEQQRPARSVPSPARTLVETPRPSPPTRSQHVARSTPRRYTGSPWSKQPARFTPKSPLLQQSLRAKSPASPNTPVPSIEQREGKENVRVETTAQNQTPNTPSRRLLRHLKEIERLKLHEDPGFSPSIVPRPAPPEPQPQPDFGRSISSSDGEISFTGTPDVNSTHPPNSFVPSQQRDIPKRAPQDVVHDVEEIGLPGGSNFFGTPISVGTKRLTPKRDPKEVGFDKGSLSVLRKRGLVKHGAGAWSGDNDDEHTEDKSEQRVGIEEELASMKKMYPSRVARHMDALSQLEALKSWEGLDES
ncbi:hypothetical protein HK104_011421 [Borealophlyctis nickersoniae]|nr:hypothetical protein HK104_011421 [Borealophlyctis nickersoniae]